MLALLMLRVITVGQPPELQEVHTFPIIATVFKNFSTAVPAFFHGAITHILG